MAAMKQKEVDERIVLDDAAVVGIVDKLIKQRKDSVDAFTKAGARTWPTRKRPRSWCCRPTCRSVCPPTKSPPQCKAIVAELGAKGPGDMGKVMGAVKARLAGKADMGQVSAAVKGGAGWLSAAFDAEHGAPAISSPPPSSG